MKTLIKKSDFNDPEKWRRIFGVVNFINELFSSELFTDNEIDEGWPQAVGVYFVDYYIAQVNNGGHLQFFLNSVHIAVNDTILKGMREINADKYVEIFKDAITTFENHREQILSFEETPDRNVFQEFAGLFEELDDAYYQLDDSISDLLYAHVKSINDLHVLEEPQYSIEFGKILDDARRKA